MRLGEWIVALGTALLVASTFLPWWDAPDVAGVGVLQQKLREYDPGAVVDAANNAVQLGIWDLGVAPWIAVIAFISAGCLLLATLFGRTSAAAIIASVPTAWFGLLLTVIVTVRVFDAPVDGATNAYGIYLGLAGAALLWLGGWQSMRDEHSVPAFDLSPEPEFISEARLDEIAAAGAAKTAS